MTAIMYKWYYWDGKSVMLTEEEIIMNSDGWRRPKSTARDNVQNKEVV